MKYPHLRVEQLLELSAKATPDRPAIHYQTTTWTFANLLDRVRRLAEGLKRLGFGPGDRLLLVLPNMPEFVATWYATLWAGGTVVPASPLNSGPELALWVEKTHPKVVVALDIRSAGVRDMYKSANIPVLLWTSLAGHLPMHLRWASRIRQWMRGASDGSIPSTVKQLRWESALDAEVSGTLATAEIPRNAVDIDAPAVFQPTGGTTGTSKLAILTHRNLVCNVAQNHPFFDRQPTKERLLAVLPFFHIYGTMSAMIASMAGSSTLVLHARFDPARVVRSIRRYRPTIGLFVPFMVGELVRYMRRHGGRLEGFKLVSSGSSALDPRDRQAFESLVGTEILEGYGLSEASPVTHSNPAGRNRPGTIGIPLPDTDARIVDAATGTTEMPIGEVGELIIRGPQVMQGYLDDPDETAHALRDGWLYTGDLARVDADGFFTIVDRKKDMIKSGGLNVYPTEVERIIESTPAVAKCAVVGEADPRFGQKVVAWVVLKPDGSWDEQSVRQRCRSELALYKVPKEFRLCDSLPVSHLGKVQRVELRKRQGS